MITGGGVRVLGLDTRPARATWPRWELLGAATAGATRLAGQLLRSLGIAGEV
jgi:hypothetical protein